jgi:3-deoxy-manno-octulosonate cytidylyltransferase (CMP-KDO synthetase)
MFSGKPMVQHVYERTKLARTVSKVIVATDDSRIAEVVKSFGGEVVMTPPDVRTGSDRAALVAKDLKEYEIIVNVQGDEPLIVPHMIDEAVQPLLDDPAIPVGTLIRKIERSEDLANPGVVKVVFDRDRFAIYFSRSPIPFYRDGSARTNPGLRTHYKHIGLYAFRRDFLLQFGSWEAGALEEIEQLEQLRMIEHGVRIKTTMTRYDSIPVDSPDDVNRVRSILQEQPTVDAQ